MRNHNLDLLQLKLNPHQHNTSESSYTILDFWCAQIVEQFTRTSRARHGGAEGGRPGTESNLRSLTWNFKIILKIKHEILLNPANSEPVTPKTKEVRSENRNLAKFQIADVGFQKKSKKSNLNYYKL